MREYEIKIKIKLDDEGYILKNNWIYTAIEEQLTYEGAKEEITEFKIREIGGANE